MFVEYSVNKLVIQLENDDLLPAILFRTSRRQCDADVNRLAASRRAEMPAARQKQLRAEVQRIAAKYGLEESVITEHPQFKPLILTGTGAHHAGQLLIWRLLLEELMSAGLLRLMIATGTVAAGVDFPARTVVITAHSKRGSDGFNVLTSSEFQQMSGRAGRRGKDSVGMCVVAPGPFSDARVIHEVAGKPAEPLRSAYFAAPSTMLNLLKFRNVDDLHYTVSRSLAAFLDRKSASGIRREAEQLREQLDAEENPGRDRAKRLEKRHRRKLREAEALERRQESELDHALKALGQLGYVEEGALTEKGYWAAELCTTLVLELAEAIDEHLFSDLAVEELVGLVASIAGDPHRVYLGIKKNPIKSEYFKSLEKIVERVREAYQHPNTSELQVLPDAALTVITWMEAENWSEFAGLLRLAGVAEGDVSRLVTQTADHLNQISRLAETHPELARTAADGRRAILRPPLSEATEEAALAEDQPQLQHVSKD